MTTYFVNAVLPTYELASPTVASTAMTASLVSSIFNIQNAPSFVMQFIWTGTPTGTLTIMGSVDGVNFNVSLGSYALSGSAGTYTLDLATTPGLATNVGWVQGGYTFSSGTGALTSVSAAKKYSDVGA